MIPAVAIYQFARNNMPRIAIDIKFSTLKQSAFLHSFLCHSNINPFLDLNDLIHS